jgi:L-fuconolactonase
VSGASWFSDRPVIDAHVHVWEGVHSLPGHSATFQALLAAIDAAGVERAVLVQPSVYGDDHRYLVEAVKTQPERFTAIGLLDPFAPQAVSRLARLAVELPLRGIRLRLQGPLAGEACRSPAAQALLEQIDLLGITLSVLTSPVGLPEIARIAGQHPNLRIAVDHLGSPARGEIDDPAYRMGLGDLESVPNVWLKLSGFYSFSSEPYPYLDCASLVRDVLSLFGPDRLVWGSDFPFVCAGARYAESLSQIEQLLSGCSAADIGNVLGGNARALWW